MRIKVKAGISTEDYEGAVARDKDRRLQAREKKVYCDICRFLAHLAARAG